MKRPPPPRGRIFDIASWITRMQEDWYRLRMVPLMPAVTLYGGKRQLCIDDTMVIGDLLELAAEDDPSYY